MPLNMWFTGAWTIASRRRSVPIGVDEIQYARGHQYPTLVYQPDRPGAHPAALAG